MSDSIDLNLLADGQLSGEELAAAEARIASDPAARAEYEAILRLKSALKSEVKAVPNRESWEAGLARLDAIDRVRPVERVVQKYSWALCAGVAATLIGAHFAMRGNSAKFNPAMAQAGSSLVRQDTKTTNISDVLRQEGINLPPITRRGLHPTNFSRFVDESGRQGTRVWLSDERGGLILDVLTGVGEIEGDPISGTKLKRVKMNAMNGVGWVKGGTGYVLVGDRSESDLVNISSKLNLR